MHAREDAPQAEPSPEPAREDPAGWLPERFDPEAARALERALGGRPLILASGSPRRRDLLTRAGLHFEVRPADIPEERRRGEAPAAFAERLALEKARKIAMACEGAALVLGADTIVVIEDDVLGKPDDAAHAERLLQRILGREHRVITAFAAVESRSGHARSQSVCSSVRMRDATSDEIRSYVATGESLDKAGAYALQGEGSKFVTAVEGSATNVIGLPVEETLALLGAVARESA